MQACQSYLSNDFLFFKWYLLLSSLYLTLSISLYLRDRDRADTVITFHHPPPTRNFLRTLELTCTQVWYIIRIVSSSPSYFCTENKGLIGVKDVWVPYRNSFGNRDLSHLSMMSIVLGIRLSLNWSIYFISVSERKREWIEERNFNFCQALSLSSLFLFLYL